VPAARKLVCVSKDDKQPPFADQLDPLGINSAALKVWGSLLSHPQSLLSAQAEFAKAWVNIATQVVTPPGTEKPAPIIEPDKGDARFKHQAWTDNPAFDALKQGYLLASKALLESIDKAPDIDDETRLRVRFFAKVFVDAMSPTNVAFLNPAVIEETFRTGGANLVRGAQNVIEDRENNNGRAALVDKSAFELGKNVAISKGNVVFRNELIELIEYAPSTEQAYERPILLIPAYINKYYILDLQPANSFVKYCVDSGLHTFIISWRNPGADLANLSMEDYVELGALTAARVVKKISGTADINVIGYCIGGTLTAMTLAYLARTGEQLAVSATFFATMTDFAHAGDLRAFLSDEAIALVEKKMATRGYLEGEEMADTFNLLRSTDLIWNPSINRYLMGKDAPAFDLLYWNADATRLPRTMQNYYLRNFYVENNLIKPDKLLVKGVPLDLGRIKNDTYAVATQEDHIAPWRSVYSMTQTFGGDVQFRLGASGHIAGIINPPSKGKGSWRAAKANPANPDEWFAESQATPGSWWPNWLTWIAERSGAKRPTADQRPGGEEFPSLGPAPGTYVVEK
jgi:polyhydroxyalkanoate synthase